MNHGSLFSGIGGFDIASEWMGWKNVFHCEWNEFGKKVLKYYWPKSISYDDITKTDFTIHKGNIDILTGGFPCQPYSMAGKRLGKEDDRHLWPEMLRAIREIQPSWVVGENVFGIVNWSGGLVFHEVQTDLEAEGYEVFPYVLPAAAVNAPHRRDRVWFIAYRNKRDWKKNGPTPNSNNPGTGECLRTDGNGQAENQRRQVQPQSELGEIGGVITHPDSNRQKCGCEQFESNEQGYDKRGDFEVNPSNPTGKGLEGLRGEKGGCAEFYTGCNERGGWETFPTQPPICGRDDGFSSRLDGITFPKWRNESIKAYGNAIVPQVVYQIFRSIEEFESNI